MSERWRRQVTVALIVEGVGDAQNNMAYRWATRALRADPHQVYVPCLDAATLPVELSGEARLRQGEVAVSGLRLRLRAKGAPLHAFYPGRPPVRVGRLVLPLVADPGHPTWGWLRMEQHQERSYAGHAVMVGRELVYLESVYIQHSATQYTYLCQRQRLETQLGYHGATSADDTEVFLTAPDGDGDHRALELVHASLRRARLIQANPERGYESERTIRRYVVREIWQPEPELVEMVLDSSLELVRARRLCGSLWRGKRTQGPREGDPQPSALYEGDGTPYSGRGLDSPQALFSVGGDTVVRWGWSANNQSGPTAFTLSPGEPRPIGGAEPFDLEEHNSEEIWECFSNAPGAPALNDSVLPTQARLSTHPVDLVLQLLTTTEAPQWGGAGLGGDWDLGVAQLGCAIPEDMLDLDAFALARAELSGDPEQAAVHLGVEGDAVDALPLIQRILFAHGYLLLPGREGRLAPRRISSSVEGGEPHLTLRDFTDKPSQRRRILDPFDRAQVKYRDRPGLGPLEFSAHDVERLKRQSTAVAQEEMDLSGVTSRAAAHALVIDHMTRWRVELAEWTLPLRATNTVLALREGDKLLVTHPLFVSGPRQRGVQAALCMVTEAAYSLRGTNAQVKVLWLGQRVVRQGQIGPGAVVSGISGAVYSIEANTYSAALVPGQADDTWRFEVGHQAQITSADGETVRGTEVIKEVYTGITLDDPVPGVVVGDVIEPAPYDTPQVDAAKAAFAFFSDEDALDDGPGDSDEEPAYQWLD